MTKIAYFDCFSGCSGDMILGAFLDAGLDLKTLTKGLEGLGLTGYQISANKVIRGSITATKFDIVTNEDGHHQRPLSEILKIIKSSSLADSVKKKSREIFKKLGEVEAGIHGTSIEEVHFHEIGAVDTIIDIVGTVFAFEELQIKEFYCSELPLGSGIVNTAHGALPIPAPATLKLIEMAGVPVVNNSESMPRAELVTPTGAVLVTAFSKFYRPEMTVSQVGYGAGEKDFSERPNIMRIWIGEKAAKIADSGLVLCETNIDDMNPQILGYVMEKLFEAKALDVWFTPIQMKKNRPAVMLSVLAEAVDEPAVTGIMLRETSTLGIRVRSVDRHIAQRKTITYESSLGKVQVKVKRFEGKVIMVTPEYEDCRQIASNNNLALQEVFRIINSEIHKNL